MDIKVTPNQCRVDHHHGRGEHPILACEGFVKEGVAGRNFVTLKMGEGQYPARQEFVAFLSVEDATQLREMLTTAIEVASAPQEEVSSTPYCTYK